MIESRKDSGFPIDAPFTNVERETAEDLLTAIATNPRVYFQNGVSAIEKENENLGIFLQANCESFDNPGHLTDYLEGATWIYMLLKSQAMKRGGALPVVSWETVRAFYADLEIDTSRHPGEDTGQSMRRNFARMEEREDGIKLFSSEICKYQVEPTTINGGMADVYFILLKAAKTESLNRLLGGQE